jgi:D-xylose transport system substrate-binding protein
MMYSARLVGVKMLSLPTWFAVLGTGGALAAALWQFGVVRERRRGGGAPERGARQLGQARLLAGLVGTGQRSARHPEKEIPARAFADLITGFAVPVGRLVIAATATLPVVACSGPPGTSPGNATQLSAKSFTLDFSAITRLRPLATRGSGSVAVILPDTVTPARYVEFDAPMLTKAMEAAGLNGSEIIVQNAQGSAGTQYFDAQADITSGARVLIVDPLDPGTGAKIESYAKSHGVPVIDYDRMTFGGSRKYYVGFNDAEIGTMLASGLKSCIAAWGVKNPQVIVMKDNPADNNATLLAHGYDAVIAPLFSGGQWKDVANLAGTSIPAAALAEFQAALTANASANAVLAPSDANAATIIRYLHRRNVQPMTFPVTGQDASLIGLQDILSGYQCGTVYKPIYREAQSAIALAMYLRAGITPPAALVSGSVKDIRTGTLVPSILVTPIWVTTANMESTVVRDNFVPASQICQGSFAADCSKYRIR